MKIVTSLYFLWLLLRLHVSPEFGFSFTQNKRLTCKYFQQNSFHFLYIVFSGPMCLFTLGIFLLLHLQIDIPTGLFITSAEEMNQFLPNSFIGSSNRRVKSELRGPPLRSPLHWKQMPFRTMLELFQAWRIHLPTQGHIQLLSSLRSSSAELKIDFPETSEVTQVLSSEVRQNASAYSPLQSWRWQSCLFTD